MLKPVSSRESSPRRPCGSAAVAAGEENTAFPGSAMPLAPSSPSLRLSWTRCKEENSGSSIL